MSTETNTIFPWERYWVPLGKEPTMHDGYFAVPGSTQASWLAPASNGVSLAALQDKPCLVLLGDVGMGKSQVVAEEFQRLKESLVGQPHQVVLCDLKRTHESVILASIFDKPGVQGWMNGQHALTLFIDSLDECWRQVNYLESILVRKLETLEIKTKPPLYLRLACRSAEWRGHVGDQLEALFQPAKKNDHQTFVLAPLSQENIRQAAAKASCSAQRLLEAIAQKRAEDLATHPVTFLMLLDLFTRDGDFPASRTELYEKGCQRLCDDRYSRPPEPSQRITNVEQRLVTAARIAAVGALTNRLLINGLESPSGRSDVLDISEVWGEAQEQSHGQTFSILEAQTREALQTALFGEIAEGVQAWRHQSYAEFLAAWHLQRKNLAQPTIIGLLTDNADGTARIIPQLEEITCWLAEMQPALFDELVAANAETFIRYGSTAWTDHQRARLIAEYLQAVDRSEAQPFDYQLRGQFALLSHEALASQILPIITNQGGNVLTREMAIDMAGICTCRAAADALIAVFLSTQEKSRIRTHAGAALQRMCDDAIRTRLKQNAYPNQLNEETDDILGLYLGILWPTHLSINEVLARLTTPKQMHYFGHYWQFLEYQLPDRLQPSDIMTVLNWIEVQQIDFSPTEPLSAFAAHTFAQSIANLSDESTRNAIVRVIEANHEDAAKLFRHVRKPTILSDTARQSFWDAIIHGHSDLRSLVFRGDLRERGLLVSDDLAWLKEKVLHSEEDRLRERWRDLVFCLFDPKNGAALQIIYELAQTDPKTAQLLLQLTSCELGSSDWLRKNYLDEQEKTQARQRSPILFGEALHRLLTQAKAGQPEQSWGIAQLLQRDPSDVYNHPQCSRLAEGVAWKWLEQADRERVLQFIPDYLAHQEVRDAEVWNKEQHYRVYSSAILLLTLLYDVARERIALISASSWARWAAVIVRHHSDFAGENHDTMGYFLGLCLSQAPEPTYAAVKRYFRESFDISFKRNLMWELDTVWSPRFETLFVSMLAQNTTSPEAIHNILYLLLRHNAPVARKWCEAELESRTNEALASVAGAVLLTGFAQEWGARIVELMEHDAPRGKAIASRLLHAAGMPKGWISSLSARHHARLWHWLDSNFPGNPYEADGGAVSDITISHEMYDYRRAVFDSFIGRSTPEACAALVNLIQLRPEDFWLGGMLAQMRKATRQARPHWLPPRKLLSSLCNADRRLIRTARDLQLLVLESLRRYERELRTGDNIVDLWNNPREAQTIIWSPREEIVVSQCLKRHLERDLELRGIVASREVQIRRRFGDDRAQVVDLLVNAIPFDGNGNPAAPVSLIVEVKCSWNDGVFDDMEVQLRNRYLSNTDYDFGIFLLVYFLCGAWNRNPDPRKNSGAHAQTPSEVDARLTDQARQLSVSGKLIESLIIDARLPNTSQN